MTAAERLAVLLAERFDGVDAAAMARHPAYRRAVGEALRCVDESGLVDQVVALGPLSGARNPHAVLVARLRQLPELAAARARLAEEVAEVRRWRRIDVAAHRGETLRALVDRGDLFADEASAILTREFADDVRAVALAALEGGRG